jgi:hypothetical protein
MPMLSRSIAALIACAGLAAALCAMPAVADNNGAVVLQGAGGALFAANKTLFSTPDGCTYVANHSGRTLSSCHAQQPASVANPDQAVIFNYGNTGVVCLADGVPTQDWQEVITPSGNASIICHGSS